MVKDIFVRASLNVLILFVFLLLSQIFVKSEEYLYILDDKCITALSQEATLTFTAQDIQIIKDSRGIILRFDLNSPSEEFFMFSGETYKKILLVEDFLAKIENPVIIEVHTKENSVNGFKNLKNWELSTVIANNIEAIITEPLGKVEQNRINSVGYGEFLPAKNTSNNGGKYTNRVDIIVLCNISGE